jgi:hypothetical protein
VRTCARGAQSYKLHVYRASLTCSNTGQIANRKYQGERKPRVGGPSPQGMTVATGTCYVTTAQQVDSRILYGRPNMLLVREIMYCKPGKVRPMVEKFVAMSALMEKSGQGKMRVMTDFVGERYWTIVAEFEAESLEAFEKSMSNQSGMDAETARQMEELMKGYHDLIDFGRREIYKLEN